MKNAICERTHMNARGDENVTYFVEKENYPITFPCRWAWTFLHKRKDVFTTLASLASGSRRPRYTFPWKGLIFLRPVMIAQIHGPQALIISSRSPGPQSLSFRNSLLSSLYTLPVLISVSPTACWRSAVYLGTDQPMECKQKQKMLANCHNM